jgi:hypothetical protein
VSKTIREQLQTQTKEWLLERLCEFAIDDDINADRTLLYLSAQKGDETEIIRDFKSALDKTN